jgi:hypothetical protein
LEAPVLDLFGIMFSSIIMMLVIVRAVQLDRTQAWFQSLKPREIAPKPETRPWKRHR